MINIVTLNYSLDVDNVVNSTIDGKETLLDADIIITNPSEYSNLWTSKTRQVPVPHFYTSSIKAIFSSRRNELHTLLENGKILVVFMSPLIIVKGKDEYGAIDYLSNYDFVPSAREFLSLKLTPGKSTVQNSIALSNPKHLFSSYYKAFKDNLEYTGYLDFDHNDEPNYFLVNRSRKPVGFSLEIGKGLIVFLPPPKNPEPSKLIGTLINCSKKYLIKHEPTPSPNWLIEYKLKGEDTFDLKLEELEVKIAELDDAKKNLLNEKSTLTNYKKLLYEQGPDLENVIIDSLKLLGFKAENRKLEDLEHDVVFESDEGRGIAEIEGKDNDAIHVGKLDQLNRVVDEDFELTGKYPQGVLIGNHYRLIDPKTRKNPFTEKVQIVAEKKSFGLLSTSELYFAVEKLLHDPSNEEFKLNCRTKILTTTGLIKLS